MACRVRGLTLLLLLLLLLLLAQATRTTGAAYSAPSCTALLADPACVVCQRWLMLLADLELGGRQGAPHQHHSAAGSLLLLLQALESNTAMNIVCGMVERTCCSNNNCSPSYY